MEKYDNEVFEFGEDTNSELEQTNSFDYDSILGLGESDYENEDLFNVEVDTEENYDNDYRIGSSDNVAFESEDELLLNEEEDPTVYEDNSAFIEDIDEPTEEIVEISEESNELVENDEISEEETVEIYEAPKEDDYETQYDANLDDDFGTSVEVDVEDVAENDNIEETIETSEELDEEYDIQDVVGDEEEVTDNSEQEEGVVISDTPIEELNKLTEYEDDQIEETDISALFDEVSVNVKEASDIFRKNTDLKQKIDSRFEELKKLQSELENSRKIQLDQINDYKQEVFDKLTEKKEEIENRLNLLKDYQATLEKEKQEFEEYKKKEQENIDKVQKEVQAAYDDRREELNHIEDILRKQKDSLDEERSQLSLDKIQYEADKNDLANNLLKFNELVHSFKTGITDTRE